MYKPRGILNEEVVGIFEYYKRSGNIPEAIINHSISFKREMLLFKAHLP